jgi:hypothetical protein
MRSHLLQQLISAGFKKEDAQNAIIRNDMNYERALADLQSNTVRGVVNDFPASRANITTVPSTIPSNVYPPIVPQFAVDIQTRSAQPTSPSDIQQNLNMKLAKDPSYLQKMMLNTLLLRSVQSGALSPEILSIVSKELTSTQIVILKQIVELQQLLGKCQESLTHPPPEHKNNSEPILKVIQNLKAEIAKLQLQLVEKKTPLNGALPSDDDASLLYRLQNMSLKTGDASHLNTATSSWPPSSSIGSMDSSPKVTPIMNPSPTHGLLPSLSPSNVIPSSSAALNIKEFIPGRPWVGDGSTGKTGTSPSDSWKAPGWGATAVGSSEASGGGLVRRGSLTMETGRQRLDGSSLSSSDWSLDMMASGGLKNDLTMSVPVVWSPFDTGRDSDAGSSSSGYQTMSSKSYHSGTSESSVKTSGSDTSSDTGFGTSINDPAENPAMKMLCNGWGGGSYEHGWSLGDDVNDTANSLLPVDLLTE